MTMPKTTKSTDTSAIHEQLTQGHDKVIHGLCEALVEWLWNQPLETIITPEELAQDFVLVLNRMNLEPLLDRNLPSMVTSARARIRDENESLQDWVPEELIASLKEHDDLRLNLPLDEFEGLIPNKLIREVLGGALADTVEELIEKFPGGGGAVLGKLARSAGKLRARTESWISSGTDSNEKSFTSNIRGLAQSSADGLKNRIIKRLKQPEHAEDLKLFRAQVAARTLEIPLERYFSILESDREEEVSLWILALIKHNLNRSEILESIGQHCEKVLQREQGSTIGELISAGRASKKLKRRWAKSLFPLATSFAKSEIFNQWLASILPPEQSTS